MPCKCCRLSVNVQNSGSSVEATGERNISVKWPEDLLTHVPLTPTRLKEAALPVENAHLRARLAQAGIDAELLLAQAGIKAIESEAAEGFKYELDVPLAQLSAHAG